MDASSHGLFHVAIDCPGYGRSRPGDCQTIRSYPGAFLRRVIAALGRRSCACLVGSSQGAAAVLNAALEHPDLVHTAAVCHPVTHKPLERFAGLTQPLLMAYDTQDAGHPVSVGRTLRRRVQNPIYFEYDGGDWLEKNFARELWDMLRASWGTFSGKRDGGRRVARMPDLTRVAGGLRCWERRHGGEVLPWYGRCGEADPSAAAPWQSGEEEEPEPVAADPGNTWRAVLEPATNTIVYENIQSGRRTKIRPNRGHVLIRRLIGEEDEGGESGQTEKQKMPEIAHGRRLFDDSSTEPEEEKKERKRREAGRQFNSSFYTKMCPYLGPKSDQVAI